MRIDTKNKLKDYFHGCSISYGRVFDEKSPFVQNVLADLAKFCRAEASTFHPDTHMSARLDGRREVYLRIREFMTLNAEQLLEKYTRPVLNTEEHAQPQTHEEK